MESKAKLFGHAIHPILIVFPLGLLTTGVIFDIVFLVGGNPVMAAVAYWMIVAGIIGGLLAAPFGWIDWFAIPSNTRAKSVGLLHGVGNMIVVLLFVGSWAFRTYSAEGLPGAIPYLFSFSALALAAVTGWLGGELVERLGVGVDDGANLNAPSSLKTESAAKMSAPPKNKTAASPFSLN